MKTTSKNLDNLKNEDNLKNGDDLKNEEGQLIEFPNNVSSPWYL